MNAPTPPKSWAVAPASPWLLLWVWIPLLLAGGLNAASSPRNLLTLGVSLFLLATGIVLSLAWRRRRIELGNGQLDVLSTFYRKRVALDSLQPDRARVVDLAEHTEYRPGSKRNGFSMPGFQSGHFSLRKDKAFCLITDASRVLVLPLRDGTTLLLSPQHPRALLDELKRLLAPR